MYISSRTRQTQVPMVGWSKPCLRFTTFLLSLLCNTSLDRVVSISFFYSRKKVRYGRSPIKDVLHRNERKNIANHKHGLDDLRPASQELRTQSLLVRFQRNRRYRCTIDGRYHPVHSLSVFLPLLCPERSIVSRMHFLCHPRTRMETSTPRSLREGLPSDDTHRCEWLHL